MSIYEKAIDKLFGKTQVAALLQKPIKAKKQTKLDIMSGLTQSEKQFLQTLLREELKALNIAKAIGKTMLKANKEDESKTIVWSEGLKYMKKKHNKLAEIQRKLKRSI